MIRFFLGFLLATVLYGAAAAGLFAMGLVRLGPTSEPAAVTAADEPDEPSADPKKPKKKRNGRIAGRNERSNLPTGSATTGDNLDWNGQREVDMNGGEGGLTGRQIEAGFDSALAKIRRCLVLVPAEGDVTGKLIFGMKVGSDGTPKAVNLSGPAVVTTGESGDCLRKAAQGIRFATFSGPDTLFKYPITLQ